MFRQFIFLLIISGLAATSAEATAVTLQEALRAAVAERPSVQMAQAQADAAAAAVSEARSGWLPHLTLQET